MSVNRNSKKLIPFNIYVDGVLVKVDFIVNR